MSKFAIIKHNTGTGHRYVHSNGGHDMMFRDRVKAEMECLRLIQAHIQAEIIKINTPSQARDYCRLRGEGLDHEDAMTGVLD